MTIAQARDELTLSAVRACLLARLAWGVRNGSAVELRPDCTIAPGEARAHVGPTLADRVHVLPALRTGKLRPVEPA